MAPLQRKFLFIAGLHRSGTTLLHDLLRDHPAVCGFVGTDAPRNEGQHLQTVYPTAASLGGPGLFGLDPAAHMTESHPLASSEQAEKLFREWSPHWRHGGEWLMEKSPPNLVRTRFLQQLFPNSSFLILLRHPIAIAYATRRFRKMPPATLSLESLLHHTLTCYERFLEDLPFLDNALVLRYETLSRQPETEFCRVVSWLGLDPISLPQQVQPDMNEKYFVQWREAAGQPEHRKLLDGDFEARANRLGYSLSHLDQCATCPWETPPPPSL